MTAPAFLVLLLAAGAAAQSPGFWEDRPRLRTARQEVGAAAIGSQVWVAGGLDRNRAGLASVEYLAWGSAAWQPAPPMPTPRHHMGMTAANGRLYVVGGYVSGFRPDARVFEYDPVSGQWAARAPLPAARGALAAVTIGGRVFAVGGVTAAGITGTLTEYDPVADRWTTRAPMPTPREHLAAAAIGGKLYAAGGRAGGRLFAALEVYDPATDRWSRLPDMPTARGGNGAAVLDGRLVVVGGEGPGGNFPEAEEFDPATATWRSLAPMSVPLHGIAPVEVGGEILVAGGGLVPGFAATDTVIAFRRLPDGVLRYGSSTPACAGPIELDPTARPISGNAGFGFEVTCCAPPGAPGAMLVAVLPHLPGFDVLGTRFHVDPALPVVALPVAADPSGRTRVRVSLASVPSGVRPAVQMVWAPTPACGSTGFLAASDALWVLVR